MTSRQPSCFFNIDVIRVSFRVYTMDMASRLTAPKSNAPASMSAAVTLDHALIHFSLESQHRELR